MLGKEIISIVFEGLRSENNEIIENSAYIAEFLSEKHCEIVNYLINSKIIDELLELLNCKETKILHPVLKVFGNIAGGTDKQTSSLIDAGFLDKIYHLLDSSNIDIKKEAFYICSNILASNDELIETFILSPCMKIIVDNMSSENFCIKKESLTGICNATFTKRHNIIMELLKFNIIPRFIRGLEENDSILLVILLQGLRNIFRSLQFILSSDKWNEFLRNFEEAEGIIKLENLQMNSNIKIHNETQAILREFFEIEGVSDISLIQAQVFEFN